MPHYDYKCKKCDEITEIFHSISDTKKRVCKKCGEKLVKQLSPGAGIIFKGTGFYSTDYKRKT